MLKRFRYVAEIVAHPQNRARKLSALARYLRWNVGRRLLDQADYAIELIPNCTVVLSNRENYATNAYCSKLYDFEDMCFLLHLLRPGDAFGDFGANVGVYSVLAGSAGATVMAVEPVPDTHRRLRRNLQLNDVKGEAVNCALGEQPAVLRFTTDRGGMNKVTRESGPHTKEVEVARADDLAGRLGIAPLLIKVDVEGWELPLLKGASALLGSAVRAIIVEMNESGAEYGFTDAAVDELLRGHGFAPFTYDPWKRELRAAAGINRNGFNTLYLSSAHLEWIRERVSGAARVALSNGLGSI